MVRKSVRCPEIDMEKTGVLLRCLIAANGMMVKDIQVLLGLGSPQPVYRWIQGKYLPSVDNLYRLSLIFGVHMEDLLAKEDTDLREILDQACENPEGSRLMARCRRKPELEVA